MLSRRWTRSWLVAAIAAVLSVPGAATAPVSAQSSPSLDPSTLGMYPGNNKGDRFARFERELGQPIRHVVTMSDTGSPEAMRQSVWGQFVGPNAYLADVADRVDAIVSIPVAFGRDGMAKTVEGQQIIRRNLLATAAGAHDADFRIVARNLKNAGYGDAIIRLGGEFDGLHPPYSARNGNSDAFIAAFRHVRDVLEAESPAFRFEWTPMASTFVNHGLPAYPGNRYVDIIGMDIYWRESGEISDSTWNNQFLKALQAQREFAIANGKAVSYAEWARSKADTPRFVDLMHGWFASLPATGPGRLVYQSYFNPSAPVDKYTPYDLDKLPNVKRRYLQLFGGARGTVAPSPTPTAAPPVTTAPPPATTVAPTTAPPRTAPTTTLAPAERLTVSTEALRAPEPPVSAGPTSAQWSVPGGPSQAAITATIDDGTMVLEWSHPQADRYILRYKKSGFRWWNWAFKNTSTSHTIDGVDPTVGYTVQVIYIDGPAWQEWSSLETSPPGSSAARSSTSAVTTAPPSSAPAPSALTSTDGPTSAQWSVPAGPSQAAITVRLDGGTMVLEWTHPDADRYIMRYKQTGSRWWKWRFQNTSTSDTIDGVDPTVGYTVQVIYIDGPAWQEWSTLETSGT